MSVIKSPRPSRRPAAMDPEFTEQRRRRRRRLSGGMLMSDLLVLQSMGEHPTQPAPHPHFMAWDLLFRQSSMTHLYSTASNSNRSTPACSPVLRKRSRSPTPQGLEVDAAMVEKGSDQSSDKSPSTPEQLVQRTCSVQTARSSGKNSKKSQSWYNHERQHILRVSMSCILVTP
ncbi:hypothetical protein AALO_G00202000 [Alosa alosa]|uniref:Uncharacterized protein n=1 Tax=Alosa alosa TaxID=278164 RepID=A0AAV6G7Q1_9TELE|nr:hypothetical protein AALO_G00202000 [Alosa alosa]